MKLDTMKYLVAIEGPDGAGKSTLIRRLEVLATQCGLKFLKRSFHDQPIAR